MFGSKMFKSRYEYQNDSRELLDKGKSVLFRFDHIEGDFAQTNFYLSGRGVNMTSPFTNLKKSISTGGGGLKSSIHYFQWD